MTNNTETTIPKLILPSKQAQLISLDALDKLVYPKRLKTGQYIVSDKTQEFGIITIKSKPIRLNNAGRKDAHMVEGYENTRTLYQHEFTFIKSDTIETDPNVSNIQSNIDSMSYPTEVYIFNNAI